jgi:hypothetical protein
MPAHRWAALTVAVVAGGCMTLAGCGGSSGGPGNSGATSPSAAATTASPAGTSSGTSGGGAKLSGNFCTDFKNIGQNIKVPASATGSLTALEHNGVRYLDQAAAYFNGLAGEAPPQAGKELRIIASDYHVMAASISSGNYGSLPKIEQQMVSLTTKGAAGTAFRNLITYMVTKCASA